MTAQTNEQVARAFSGHDFESVVERIGADVTWTLVGGDVIAGRDAVVAACRDTAAYLADVSTEFSLFRTVVGENAVVVDSRAEYREVDGSTSAVASCDIYDFDNGMIVAIVSYAVELTA